MENLKLRIRFRAARCAVGMLLLLGVVSLSGLATGGEMAQSASGETEIGIDQKLGAMVPLDVELLDESGESVTLKQLVGDKPFVLTLVYYRCPGICSPLLGGVAEVVDRIDLQPGEDFHVITVSFDPTEAPQLAKEKKANYLEAVQREMPEDAWRFLTGPQESIDRITRAVGFRYQKRENDFIHSAAVMAISPEGKVTRYLFGITYLPFDLKMALVEASQGRVGPTINKVLLYCFGYDPQGRSYALNILRVAGTLTTMVGLAFLTFLLITTRMIRRQSEGSNNARRGDGASPTECFGAGA